MLTPNTTLRNRYLIQSFLGRGGMADVYLALDQRRQVQVAIKVLREDLAEDPEFLARFRREAQALARLDHPYIVRFYSFEREGVTAFIVMDYVPGSTLRRHLMEVGGPLPLPEITHILQNVSSALHYAHNEGFVHRDIKPGNIMLREDGAALLADFGIARVAETATMTMGLVGTPAYMSPEQILGQKVDARSDIYSLGVVLYQMVAGVRPFRGHTGAGTTTIDKIRYEHLHASPPDPRAANPALPEAAAQVIRKALAKQPAKRWQTTVELERAWEQALEGHAPVISKVNPIQVSSSHEPQPSSTSSTNQPKRNPAPGQPSPQKNNLMPILLAMGIVIAVAALFLWVFSGWSISTPPKLSPTPVVAQSTASSASETVLPAATVDVEGTAGALAATYAVATRRSEATLNALTEERARATLTAIAATATSQANATQAEITRQAISATQTAQFLQTQQAAATATAASEATHTAQIEATRIVAATATALAQQPPPLQYKFISIKGQSNSNNNDGYANPPQGRVKLGGVLFDLGQGESITTQAAPLPNNPQKLRFDVNISNPAAVYLLITGGDLFTQFNGQLLGSIRLLFADGQTYERELVAGKNIREWKHHDNTVVSSINDPNVTEVWRGLNHHDTGPAVLDMQTITIPKSLRNQRLVAIEILDETQTTVGNMDPAINLSGITIAHH